MRLKRVTAEAFGPFRDETLEFGPELNVIYGPNEAGKSSWHAAIYAAFCGMRRGRGARRLEAERSNELQKFVRARPREGRRVREALEGGLPDRLDGSPARFLEQDLSHRQPVAGFLAPGVVAPVRCAPRWSRP